MEKATAKHDDDASSEDDGRSEIVEINNGIDWNKTKAFTSNIVLISSIELQSSVEE